jgi:hypothetical protein
MNNAVTKLNPVQLHLLDMFSIAMSEENLKEIKILLEGYLARKVDEESEKLWESKNMDAKSIDDLLNSHLRTSYK